MKEFKYLLVSQMMAILFLLGIVIGSTICQVRIVQLPTPKMYPDRVIAKAMKYHGTLGAFYDDISKHWYFIDKQGRPCKLFKVVQFKGEK